MCVCVCVCVCRVCALVIIDLCEPNRIIYCSPSYTDQC